MRKNINKIIAFAIGVSVMGGSIIPAVAVDNGAQQINNTNTTASQMVNGKPVLTLDEAIKDSIGNSETLAIDENKIGYIDKTGDLYDDEDDANKVSDDVHDFNKNNQDIKLNQANQQKDFDQDMLEKKVVDKYNDIVTKQMNIDKTAKELNIKKTELQNLQLKLSVGSEVSTDLESKELEIQDKQNTLTYTQNQLNDSEYSFKVLTGKDVTQYALEQDISFEPFKIDGSIDNYLDNVIDSFLKYSIEIVNLNRDYFDRDYEENNGITLDDLANAETTSEAVTVSKPSIYDSKYASNSDNNNAYSYLKDYQAYQDELAKQQLYTNKIKGRIAYITTKQGLFSDEDNISSDKKKLKDSLKSYYTDLLKNQAQIEYDKKNIEVNNEKLKDAKLKHDLGMMTDIDYNTLVVNSETYDLQLRNDIIAYNDLKEEIQKPWLSLAKSAMQSQQQHQES